MPSSFTGEAARLRGNEGQARVCARRAAGIAIREYLRPPGASVPPVQRLRSAKPAQDDPELSRSSGNVEHLTMRVTQDFKLPVEADLLAEARAFCAALLPGWDQN